MWSVLIAALIGYLLGNLNGAVCISGLHHDDVRTHGSGNAGLTNFIRNYGVGQAIFVILIDAGKAIVSCVLGGLLVRHQMPFINGAAIGGLAVMLGHIFPAFLGFRGGKGILSGLFVAFFVDYRVALVILAVFAVAYIITGYVSVGSVLAATAFCVMFAFLHYDNLVVMIPMICAGVLAIYMHRTNMVRLIQGKEKRTNLFSKK